MKLFFCITNFVTYDGFQILKGQVFAADEIVELPFPESIHAIDFEDYWQQVGAW